MLFPVVRPILQSLTRLPGNLIGTYAGTELPNPETAPCSQQIVTPVDETITIPATQVYCSSGAIEVDTGIGDDGIVVINGAWRLT